MDYHKHAFDYAWGYFSVHATHRMQSVYFFLVAAAFLMAGYGTAIVHDLYMLAMGMGILGAAVAFIFYRIEQRIRALVHAAEAALTPIENSIAEVTGSDAFKILEQVERPKAGAWAYSKVFRYLYLFLGLTFVSGAVYAGWLLSGHTAAGTLEFSIIVGSALSAILVIAGHELLGMAVSVSRETGERFGLLRTRWLQVLIALTGAGTVLCGVVAALYVVFRLLPNH